MSKWQQLLQEKNGTHDEKSAGLEDTEAIFHPPSRMASDNPDCIDSSSIQPNASIDVVQESLLGGRTVCIAPAPEEPIRSITLEKSSIRIDILVEGDGKTCPKDYVLAHLIGRLSSGAVFESTRGKGKSAMKLTLGKGSNIPGIEAGLHALSLGARAVIHIPSAMGYGPRGIPKVVPPDSDLSFEVEILEVDGNKSEDQIPSAPVGTTPIVTKDVYALPWWLARVKRPSPNPYYLSFCRHRSRGTLGDITGAVQISRKSVESMQGWDPTNDLPCIVVGMQKDWPAKQWDLDWIKDNLGTHRALVKWQGPIFREKEALWETPVWETSVAEYIDYIKALEVVDPECSESNAQHCPRLYLNGWPIFEQMQNMRSFVKLPSCVNDVSAQAKGEVKMVQESIYQILAGRSAQKFDDEEFQTAVADSDWELTKVFISPAGAVTRLHYDNGGAHAWLSQIRGRKLFVCYKPDDTPYLHAFKGDEGKLSASFLDPLAEDLSERWPDHQKATPYVAIVEEGETIVAPVGWWHYAVSLDTSITIMRNFYSSSNKQELHDRQIEPLVTAVTQALKAGKLKDRLSAAAIAEKASALVTQVQKAVLQRVS